MTNAPALAPTIEAAGLVKRFGRTVALAGVDLRIDAGQCLGLVGRNGAGKSTVVSILSGITAPDQGSVRFDGLPAPKPADVGAWRSKIATVYQHSMVVPQLTVAENIYLGQQLMRNGAVDWKAMRNRSREIIDEWGFAIPPDALCEDLTVEQLQIVEIARALVAGAKCVLLDEPTAALERDGVARLFDRVHQLVAAGVAVLFISHHLEEVFEVCQDVMVLRDGRVVRQAPITDIDKEQIVTAMVGELPVSKAEAAAARHPVLTKSSGQPRLVVQGLRSDSLQGALHGVDLEIHAGERVGVTGLLSAGVGTLGRAVAGAEGFTSGRILVDGKPIAAGRRDLVQRAGVGYVPGDRQVDGFVGLLGVAENTTMSVARKLAARLGFVRPAWRARAAAPVNESLSLISSGPNQPVQELSGGNQQKVTVGRALIDEPGVIVAITPTRGVDVASKSLLLGALSRAARDTGAALLLVSDELDDMAECDRVVVLVRGEVFTEFREPPFDREELIAATEGLITPARSA